MRENTRGKKGKKNKKAAGKKGTAAPTTRHASYSAPASRDAEL